MSCRDPHRLLRRLHDLQALLISYLEEDTIMIDDTALEAAITQLGTDVSSLIQVAEGADAAAQAKVDTATQKVQALDTQVQNALGNPPQQPAPTPASAPQP